MRDLIITLSLIILVSNLATAQERTLVVVVKNLKSTEGSVRVAIFDNEKDFLKKPVKGKSVKATGSSVKVTFEGLPAGAYGISVFHDENDNGKLDTNFIGIPTEGFAFGNNAMGTFGPPSFDRSKVELNEEATQEIDLRFF